MLNRKRLYRSHQWSIFICNFRIFSVTTFVGSGSASFRDHYGTTAAIDAPHDCFVNPSNTLLYIADSDNNRIRVTDIKTRLTTTLAGNGAATSTDGVGTFATLHAPQAMVLDGTGDFYVADYGSQKIRKVTLSGVVTTFAGSTAGKTLLHNVQDIWLFP